MYLRSLQHDAQRLAGKCRAALILLSFLLVLIYLKKRIFSFISYANMAFTGLLGSVAALEAQGGNCR